MEMDKDAIRIALSSDGSQLASILLSRIKLVDLESKKCLSDLKFAHPLWWEGQVLFAINGTDIVLHNSDSKKSWRISPNNISGTQASIMNSDGSKSWLVSVTCSQLKLPMVFVPITNKRSYQDASQFSRWSISKDNAWILDQSDRHILWIPQDEISRRCWSSSRGRKIGIETESGKVYIVNISPS